MAEYIVPMALEDFKNDIMDILIRMCYGNDYNTLKLFQMDEVIYSVFNEHVKSHIDDDVKEVQHGTWELEEYNLYWDSPDQCLRCSLCGYSHGYDEWFEFCPGCGNPMDGNGDTSEIP